MAAMQTSEPAGSCIVGACERPGVVLMTITSLGGTDEAMFCEGCAAKFEPCWRRVHGKPQLQMEFV